MHTHTHSIVSHSSSAHSRRIEIDELDKAIGQLNRSINASSYQLLTLIREFDERAGWLRWSFTDGVSWLKWRCDIGTGAAREKLRIAHALKELPCISAEFEAGRLSYSKVRVMTRIATDANEQDLIAMARRMTVQHLTEHCKQRSNARPESTAVAQVAQNSREFRVWPDAAKGTLHFSIELPAEDGELIDKAVEKASVQYASQLGTASLTHSPFDDEPSWSSMQADALVHIMRWFLSVDSADTVDTKVSDYKASTLSDAKPRSTADNYQVVVHVDESSLTGSTSNTNTATSQYPIETVRRLCCDGSIVPIIENSKGETLNVGRKVRTITTAIRRALISRDGGCAFPGCSHKRFVDAHHIKHWAHGGETTLANLVLLCSSHHKLVHEGGYTIQTDHSGQLFFKRPDGRAVPDCGFYCEDWQDTVETAEIHLDSETGPDTDPETYPETDPEASTEKSREFSANEVREDCGAYTVH